MEHCFMNRIEREQLTIRKMIRIYCRNIHSTKRELCTECADLQTYSMLRLSKCQYQNEKPACAKCKTHCYRKDYREKIRQVMRFSGKRMIFRHPVLAIWHLVNLKF